MVIRTIAQAALTLSLAFMGPPTTSETVTAPEGLRSCPPGDPVATVEAGLATKLGGDFLGCFRSDSTVAATNPAPPATTPIEYAFALALHDHDYTESDIHELLSKIEQQWKDFKPLDGKLSAAYLARLNEIINGQRKESGADVKSVRPILVKIDGDHSRYYTVTSIRTYAVASGSANVTIAKVNADAVVLRDSKLVRLTIQRALIDSADVGRAQVEIDRWAKSIAKL